MKTIDCKVVMLPTNKQGLRLFISSNDMIMVWTDKLVKTIGTYNHLYFTSDEEIKEDDWRHCPNKGSGIDVGNGIPKPNYGARITRGGNSCHDCRKILASTDPSLGLPSIPESFLKQYVAVNGKINSVKLGIGVIYRSDGCPFYWDGKTFTNSDEHGVIRYDFDPLWKYKFELTDNNEVVIVENAARLWIKNYHGQVI